MWTAGFPLSPWATAAAEQSRPPTCACIGMCARTHSHTHWGNGLNSSKAMFDSSFFSQPLSLPSRFSRSEIDQLTARGDRWNLKSHTVPSPPSFSKKNPKKKQSLSHVFNNVPMSVDLWLNSFHLIVTVNSLKDRVSLQYALRQIQVRQFSCH